MEPAAPENKEADAAGVVVVVVAGVVEEFPNIGVEDFAAPSVFPKENVEPVAEGVFVDGVAFVPNPVKPVAELDAPKPPTADAFPVGKAALLLVVLDPKFKAGLDSVLLFPMPPNGLLLLLELKLKPDAVFEMNFS